MLHLEPIQMIVELVSTLKQVVDTSERNAALESLCRVLSLTQRRLPLIVFPQQNGVCFALHILPI